MLDTYLYAVAIAFIVSYVLIIVAVNRVPRVKVSSLGWFCFKRVTIDLGRIQISIRRLQLTLNLYRPKDAPYKLFQIKLYGVTVEEKKIEPKTEKSTESADSTESLSESKTTTPSSSTPSSPTKTTPKKPSSPNKPSPHSPLESGLDLLSRVQIKKWLYDFVLTNKLINRASVDVSHCAVHAAAGVSLFVDFARAENTYSSDGSARIALTVFNGHMREHPEDLEQKRIFHSVAVQLAWDTVLSCIASDPSLVLLDATNIAVLTSVTGLTVPVEKFVAIGQRLDQKRESRAKSAPKLPFSGALPLKSVELRLEDIAVSTHDWAADVSTLILSLTRVDPNFMKAAAYLTSLKARQHDSPCVELPSATLAGEYNEHDLIKMSFSSLSFRKVSCTLTDPIIDVYYDQLGSSLGSGPSKGPYKKLLPLLPTMKVVVVDLVTKLHLPPTYDTEFHRELAHNVVITASVLSMVYVFRQSRSNHMVHFFKTKNFNLDAVDNVVHLLKFNVMAGYSTYNHKMTVKVMSKTIRLRSVNAIIFHIVRLLRNRKIADYNERCADMVQVDQVPTIPTSLFDILPPWVSSVKVLVASVQIDIICKDELPLHVFYDEKLGEDVDLGAFKRGVAVKITDATLVYRKSVQEFLGSVQSIDCFTLSEYVSEIPDSDLLDFRSSDDDFSDISSFALDHSDKVVDARKIKKVLGISDTQLSNTHNRLKFTIPEIEGRFDMFLVWCTIYAKLLVSSFASTVEKKYSHDQVTELHKRERGVDIDLEIGSVAMVAKLPNQVNVMVEVDRLVLSNAMTSAKLSIDYVRGYVVHPATKLWTRLLLIKDPCVSVRKDKENTKEESKTNEDSKLVELVQLVELNENDLTEKNEIEVGLNNLVKLNLSGESASLDYLIVSKESDLDVPVENQEENFAVTDAFTPDLSLSSLYIDVVSTFFRLNIPHQFPLYTVIDNVITMVKAIRQITHNFEKLKAGEKTFPRIMPLEKAAIKVPNISVRTGHFGVTLENDPFDTHLSYIYEYGQVEQRKRMMQWRLFDKKCKEIRSRVRRPEDLTYSRQKYTSPLQYEASKGEGSGPSEPGPNDSITSEEAEATIAIARDRLLREMSALWVYGIRKFLATKTASWAQRVHRVWGDDIINPLILDKYSVQDYAPGPSLMGAIIKDLNLEVAQAHLDVDSFLYELGKLQPRLAYSILIPVFLRLRAKSFYVFLKDYSLPLLSFPEARHGESDCVDLSGNVVINEKLVTRKEEMRYIFVPFSPAASTSDTYDSFYSAHIPRTLTPVKFMVDLKCRVSTDRACIVSWSKSYQAALSLTMTALDNFTKPEVDDLPLGWWDKAALLMHGKLAFTANELCLHIKSATSPYALVGRAAGFVFSWKNNVSLNINSTGRADELIVLDSDDFLLAIPNYSAAEKQSWSLFYDELNQYGPTDESDADDNKYLKRVMRLSSDERVSWTVGLLFERNQNESTELSPNQPRTRSFRPHYEVVVTNPAFDWHPDSYEGFRSDYLHLAISVRSTSKSGNCSNAAYLTPMVFHYFFHWWDTLTDVISLPIKQGPLFGAHTTLSKSHIKLGPHMFTVKYQLVLDNLVISHLYKHSTGDLGDNKFHVAYTGLKAHFGHCYFDLHQRKELVRYVNEKLNINNRVFHLKMNHGEIDIDEADIRFFSAVFSEKSITGHLASFLAKDSDLDKDKESSSASKFDTHDLEELWADPDDFVELEADPVVSFPQIQVIPFCFSPKFTYFRDFSFQEDGDYPFGNEPVHKCLLGSQTPNQVQRKLLKERIAVVKQEISDSEMLVRKLEAANDPEFTAELEQARLDVKIAKDKLDVVELIRESMTDGMDDSEDLSSDGSIGSEFGSTRSLPSAPTQLSRVSSRELTQLVQEPDFHNRFIVHNLQLKWDNQLRDLFIEYVQKVVDRRLYLYFMSSKAVKLVESVQLQQTESQTSAEDSVECPAKHPSGEELLRCFEEKLSSVDPESQEPLNKYLFKLIHPQIQLVSKQDSDLCMLVTSRDLEVRIVNVSVKGMNDVISENASVAALVESRYGMLFKDYHVFVFKKDDHTISNPDVHYGALFLNSNVNWPPWLECEVCYDLSWVQDELVVERNTLAVVLTQPNYLFAENKGVDKGNDIAVYTAKVVVNATSEQYSTVYYVVTDLLVHGKTARDEILNRLDKVVSLSDEEDFEGLDVRVKELQTSIRLARSVLLRLDAVLLPLAYKSQISHLRLEVERMNLELIILMRGLGFRVSKQSFGKHATRVWTIVSDQVIWHLLDLKREPFIDFALANSKFTRLDSSDGCNVNTIDVGMIQGFNLQDDSVYPELLRPFVELEKPKSEKERLLEDSKLSSSSIWRLNSLKPTTSATSASSTTNTPIIKALWKMLEPVGGIPIMQHALLAIQPLKIQLDYDTTRKLFHYVFPSELKSEQPEETDAELLSLADSQEKDDISIIMKRSSQFISIVDIEVDKFDLSISFKAPLHLHILDVHNLHLRMPLLLYKNKLWTMEDFILRLRKDVIKTILNHTGKILGNKFRQRKRRILSEPLKQISNYASFMTLQDLQLEGRSRDAAKTDSIGPHPHPRPHHHHHHHLKRRTSDSFAYEQFLSDIDLADASLILAISEPEE